MVSSKLRTAVFLVVAAIITFFSVTLFNQFQVYPSKSEVEIIKQVFPGADQIKSFSDLIDIQNLVIDSIFHKPSSTQPLDIIYDIHNRAGLCYNRSLLLQKIMLLNGLKIRPVYLYFSSGTKTRWFDFFSSKIESHAIFEVKFNGHWYVVRTNKKMKKMEDLDAYLKYSNSVPSHARYIRYLSNRNGKFILPSFIPDIYGLF